MSLDWLSPKDKYGNTPKSVKLIMQKITAHLLNQTKFLEIFQFASNVLSKIEAEGIRPITYGSLAYLAYTNDNSIEVSDIDFLVPEEQFNKLIHILKNSTDIKIETTNYHSLKLLKDDLKISFDAIEHYLRGCPLHLMRF